MPPMSFTLGHPAKVQSSNHLVYHGKRPLQSSYHASTRWLEMHISATQVDTLANRKTRGFPTQILNFFKSWEVPIFQTLSPHSPGYKTYLGISHNGSIISSVYQGMDPILGTVGLRRILVHRPWHRRCSPASATKRLAVSSKWYVPQLKYLYAKVFLQFYKQIRLFTPT